MIGITSQLPTPHVTTGDRPMLYISLFLSAVLLVAANWAARYAKQPIHETIAWSVIVIFWQCVVFSPAVMLQAAVLCGGVLLAAAFGRGRGSSRRCRSCRS